MGIGVVLVALFFLFRKDPDVSHVVGASETVSTPAIASKTKKPPTIFPSNSGSVRSVESVDSAGPLESAVAPGDPAAQIRIDELAFLLRDFRNQLSQNPVGTNAEITAALLGNNPKQARFAVPVGSSLNQKNELCDFWGTPYFFHQLSASLMEVRSAGADRRMWNDDDLIAR